MRSNTLSTEAESIRVNLYVDESGQDTKGKLFVVAVVAVGNSDVLSELFAQAERSGGLVPL